MLTLGISPCPNDTFIFEAWVTGELQGGAWEPPPHTTFLDVQNLNEAAARAEFDVIKVSCGALPALKNEYVVLPTGGAMGYGCGPLLLSHGSSVFDPQQETWLPGRNTTAAILFSHWSGGAAKVRYALFDEVYRALRAGKAQQGVVIHEHRFTFARDGLLCLQDLGAHWESTMNSPIPLGVILARRSLGDLRIHSLIQTIRESLRRAWMREELVSPFVRSHAQETDTRVMEAHIRMFVNDFTMEIGEAGLAALSRMESLAKPKAES